MVAHSYNPSYSGGEDLEDCGLRPPWVKIMRLYLKNKVTKGWGTIQVVRVPA
jgi:hypothetical protein